MEVIVLTAMHGRHDTVKYCFEQMPDIKKVVMYSTKEDGEFLKQFEEVTAYQVDNEPLSNKWNKGIFKLREHRFNGIILLGSDDWVDDAFIDFAKSNIHNYDMIGFNDLYFDYFGECHYWKGYDNHRVGEPGGAGKIYSRKFLDRLGWSLFPLGKDRSLDGLSWEVVQENTDNILITSMRKEGIFCCDVKDGEGMTQFDNITNTVPCESL